mgnify:FL=1
MIKFYLFTYSQDEEEALQCILGIRAALPEAAITVVDDQNNPCSQAFETQVTTAGGSRYMQSSFARKGNLRGPDCIRGIIDTLAEDAENQDLIVKIDSDTLLVSGNWLREMKSSRLVYYSSGYANPKNYMERTAYGVCYALKGEAVKKVKAELAQRQLEPLAPEDLTIAQTVRDLYPSDLIYQEEPWSPQYTDGKWAGWNWWSRLVTPEKYSGFKVVTFGTMMPANYPRELRALKMKELREYVHSA